MPATKCPALRQKFTSPANIEHMGHGSILHVLRVGRNPMKLILDVAQIIMWMSC